MLHPSPAVHHLQWSPVILQNKKKLLSVIFSTAHNGDKRSVCKPVDRTLQKCSEVGFFYSFTYELFIVFVKCARTPESETHHVIHQNME